MNCIKCGLKINDNAKFCSECGTKQNGQLTFYNWLAFISYSHKDTEVAKYIEAELKKYKLPLIIEQNNPALKKLRFDQIFRDENNFGNGALEDQIQFGLQNSKFLIAICSPNYAKANNEGINWCDEEIKQFLSYHNNDDTLIIPVIIDGVPHSDNECFPPALLNLKAENGKSKEALGIAGTSIKKLLENGEEKSDISTEEKQAKDEIFDAIKARLLGLNYGAYKNYAHQEKYYLDYVDVNGIPKGIQELENGAWMHTKHYKFIYREDLLDEVRYENGDEAVIVHSDSEERDKIVDSFFFYDEKGALLKIEEKNIHGFVSRVDEFKKNYCVINFTDAEDDSKMLDASFSISGTDDEMISHKSTVKSIRLTRDENGYILSKSYHKYHNEIYPVCDNDGVYGIEYENDAEGRILKIWYLNADGEHFSTKNGIAGKIYKYDKNGFRIKDTFIDSNENYIMNENGFASMSYTYDSNANPIKAVYHDVENQPVISKHGISCYCNDYDDKGNNIRTSYFGLNNEKVISKQGFSSYASEYDEKGNILKKSFLGLKNEPVLYDGFASYVQIYDSRNYIIQQSYYGLNNEPVETKEDGVHKIKSFIDEKGNIMEGRFFGIDGKPKNRKSGDAITCFKRDKNGNPVEVSSFDVDGQPALYNGEYSKISVTYDDFANPIERRYYGKDNKLCLCKAGYAIDRSVYDARGHRTQISYFGTNEERILCDKGYSVEQCMFDEQGNILELSYFGVNEEPVLNNEGTHTMRCKYDKAGHRTETTYFGIHDESILCGYGYFKECVKYNEYGDFVDLAYYGLQGEPVVVKEAGFSRILLKYEHGRIVERQQFGAEGKSILKRFNSAGKEIEIAQFDGQNQPVEDGNGFVHYYFSYFDDNATIRMVKRCLLNENYSVTVYNKYGSEVELTYYKKDGSLRTGRTFAKRCTQYNEQNKKVLVQEIFEDNTSHNTKYNLAGKIEEDFYLDVNGKLLLSSKGYAKLISTYDERGNILETNYFGADGLKILYRNYASAISKYDDKNNCTETAFFGLNGEPVLNMTNRHKWTTVYDEKGNKIEECSYGTESEPVMHSNGYFRWLKTYDAQGNCTSTIYYDTENKEIRKE